MNASRLPSSRVGEIMAPGIFSLDPIFRANSDGGKFPVVSTTMCPSIHVRSFISNQVELAHPILGKNSHKEFIKNSGGNLDVRWVESCYKT